MQGRRASGLGFAVLAVLLAVAGAAVAGDLVADAGDSRQTVGFGTTLDVEGQVFGGQAPYNVTWTLDGSGEPFANASRLDTRVDLDGLEGPAALNLSVEDAAGNTASDEVLYHAAERLGEPVNRTVEVGPGTPVTTTEHREVAFEVPEDAGAVRAELSWQDGPPGLVVLRNDLDLVLLDPDGEEATGNQGRSLRHPERVVARDPAPGTWTAEIEVYASSPEEAHLTAETQATAELPKATVPGPTVFGLEDEARLVGEARGPDGTEGAWDVDADGHVEVHDTNATLDADPGLHDARFTVETPAGYEAAQSVTANVTDAAEHARPLHCSSNPYWTTAAEFSASGGTCWMHGGHHTYVLDEPGAVVGAVGRVFSVEQQFSPPTAVNASGDTPMRIQVSLDGQDWTTLHNATYAFLPDVQDGERFPSTRQSIAFDVGTEPTPAAYLRIHQPRSAAQGLSGFLDASRVYLLTNDTDAKQPTPDLHDGTARFACEDGHLFEDFFAEHPCWFGGINRYDTPSFFHTYEPGHGTTVTEVEATAQVAPWRTDDWFLPIPVPVQVTGDVPPARVDEDQAREFRDQVQQTRVFLQASTDGEAWRTLGNATVPFGEPATFTADLEQPEPARFLRLIPDEHPRFDDRASAPSLHHPEAYFLHSELVATGKVPAAQR